MNGKLKEGDLSPGDVVCMKSSNVMMTVDDVSMNGKFASCLWFDSDNRLHRDSFRIDILVLTDVTYEGLTEDEDRKLTN